MRITRSTIGIYDPGFHTPPQKKGEAASGEQQFVNTFLVAWRPRKETIASATVIKRREGEESTAAQSPKCCRRPTLYVVVEVNTYIFQLCGSFLSLLVEHLCTSPHKNAHFRQKIMKRIRMKAPTTVRRIKRTLLRKQEWQIAAKLGDNAFTAGNPFLGQKYLELVYGGVLGL